MTNEETLEDISRKIKLIETQLNECGLTRRQLLTLKFSHRHLVARYNERLHSIVTGRF